MCEPTNPSGRGEARLVGISTFTTDDDLIRVLTTAPRIKPTSIFLRSARRPNPGRRSTYQRGICVQTTGTSSKYVSGLNKGLYNLASGSEVLAYFDQVMQQRFLPSGRVQYFPMCNVTGENRFVSTLTGQGHEVVAKRAVVDAAYCTFEIPSTHPPKYSIALGVRCIPPNELPRAAKSGDNYVIVGAGKTAMDV